ncbi:MAG TPA: NAD(P)/FAD-dependent oxidoreductase [Candidatus Limnocylindrales bacterium]|nr:NAD(P)/FAD-dependent oxidoreductase [Candidatus Limnocylindrales bacterium]
MDQDRRHRVLVVGGGFAGLYAARSLRSDPEIAVTVLDRRNFHLFQPMLYQVATGALSPGEIAQPLRSILARQRNATVILGEAVGIDVDRRHVSVADGGPIGYDTLIVATGAHHTYFGHDEWATVAPGLKSIEDATEIRRRILIAFEAAEREADPDRRREWMTFVLVGGGPTGVELAGSLGEIARDTLRRNFRAIDPADARIILVEAMDRVLPPYPPDQSASAQRQLERLGVIVRVGTRVTAIDDRSVRVVPTADSKVDPNADPNQPEEIIPARTVLWGAGVQASSFARKVAEAAGATTDRNGRVIVEGDLTVPGHPEIFVVGDAAVQPWGHDDERITPGVAQGAIQGGTYAAKVIRRRILGRPYAPFRYSNHGDVAVIGRLSGVTNIPWMGPFGQRSGFVAWLLWLGIHIAYLIGFANRLVVLTRWAASFFTHGRGTRLITGSPLLPPIEAPEPPVIAAPEDGLAGTAATTADDRPQAD